MRDELHEYKYYRLKRNGKDCYILFCIERFGETIFNSAVHKISLNTYRILKAKKNLASYLIYI